MSLVVRDASDVTVVRRHERHTLTLQLFAQRSDFGLHLLEADGLRVSVHDRLVLDVSSLQEFNELKFESRNIEIIFLNCYELGLRI